MRPYPIEVKRHYTELSSEETDEVVEAIAGLIVNYVKKSKDPAPAGRKQESDHEREQTRYVPRGR